VGGDLGAEGVQVPAQMRSNLWTAGELCSIGGRLAAVVSCLQRVAQLMFFSTCPASPGDRGLETCFLGPASCLPKRFEVAVASQQVPVAGQRPGIGLHVSRALGIHRNP
jgi:hypothetical protein